jgi:predicted nucleic acid-binding protein
MRRAVFDTNVIVSGLLCPHGPPGRIVDWLRLGVVGAVLDDRIAGEYADVLARSEFSLPSAEAALVLNAIRRHAIWAPVTAADVLAGLPDPDDAAFLECARAAGVALVTGNVRHYPKSLRGEINVLTPAEFVAAMSEDAEG